MKRSWRVYWNKSPLGPPRGKLIVFCWGNHEFTNYLPQWNSKAFLNLICLLFGVWCYLNWNANYRKTTATSLFLIFPFLLFISHATKALRHKESRRFYLFPKLKLPLSGDWGGSRIHKFILPQRIELGEVSQSIFNR